jgi:hypothetical protein
MKLVSKIIISLVTIWSVAALPQPALANHAILSIAPSTGTFVVDSTFEASIYLNTHGQSINTVELALKFPPDKLQLVSSSTGKSVIGLWATLPKFNNETGTVELVGGIPGGLNFNKGLITTLTFRVKAVGSAVLRFSSANVLLHDGSGTEILTQTQNSIFDLVLPPPEGPVVVSDTHPDQGKWSKSASASLRWGDEGGLEGFSYHLSDNPSDVPDDVSEGKQQSVVYRNLSEGHHYFHIKGLRDGKWGGVSHYALNVDTHPPAQFRIELVPGNKTSRMQPVVQFATTDSASGIDFYELKLIPLSSVNADQPLFIEAHSPYVTSPLEYGKYDVVVRAHDQAGNYVEATERLQVAPAFFQYVGDKGLEFRSRLLITWPILWGAGIFLLLALSFVAYRAARHHRHVATVIANKELPPDLQVQLNELQRYRNKYGQIGAFILAAAIAMFASGGAHAQDAQNSGVINPPIITTYPKDITNDDMFYVGGKIDVEGADIVLFIQNLQTAEVIQETVKSDSKGEWFYKHDARLSPGNYLLWGQAKIGSQSSPPSPQANITVTRTVLQFGATRLTYDVMYVSLIGLLLVGVIALILYILHHRRHAKKKHSLVLKEIREAEESLRRGFAVLNRDILAELDVMKRAKLHQRPSLVEKKRELQLVNDLQEIEKYVAKELWDIEQAEQDNASSR